MQTPSRLLRSAHRSSLRFWPKLQCLADVSARRDRWILGLFLLMTQRVGPEDEEGLFAHLDLDRFPHYYATFDTFEGF